MEEINEQANKMQDVINIGNDPVMLTATEVLAKLMIKNDSGGTIVADQSVGSTDTGNSGTDWTHFALVRNGNTWTHYRNGTSNWSTTSSDAHVNHDGGITLIGENTTSTSWAMNGYFDDIRISNGSETILTASMMELKKSWQSTLNGGDV